MRNYLLLTPGPLSTSETVRQAMLQDWCTWDKDYNLGVVTPLREGLLEVAGLDPKEGAYTTVLLQGSGTYGVEATITCAVRPTDKLLIVSNGAYGKRMADIVRHAGIPHVHVALKETEQVTPEVVKRAIAENPDATHFSVVHCETTTGILNPVADIAPIVKGAGLTLIVDAMSSFGGIPIDIQGLGIDFLISSANKCIQGVPGFCFVIARRSALEKCKGVSRSLSLDIYDQWETMEKGGGKWRFTSPTHVVRAFFQALQELKAEGGVEARYARYRENHDTLVKGMREAGFRTLLDDQIQSPIITSFLYPSADFNFADFYERLKAQGFVIYPGKISEADTFRIGNIGDVFPDDFKRLTDIVKSL